MRRDLREHPIGIMDVLRNGRISRKRSKCGRGYAVIKNVFGAGHIMVTTVKRAAVKMTMATFNFNLYQLRTLKMQEMI